VCARLRGGSSTRRWTSGTTPSYDCTYTHTIIITYLVGGGGGLSYTTQQHKPKKGAHYEVCPQLPSITVSRLVITTIQGGLRRTSSHM
jgi:hypothetical protein